MGMALYDNGRRARGLPCPLCNRAPPDARKTRTCLSNVLHSPRPAPSAQPHLHGVCAMIAMSTTPGQALASLLPDHPLLVMDVGGQVQSWSAGAERVCGYAAAQIVGRSLATCYAPEEQRRLRDEIQEALTAG